MPILRTIGRAVSPGITEYLLIASPAPLMPFALRRGRYSERNREFGAGRLFLGLLPFALFANMHAQELHLLPNRLWYSRADVGFPPDGFRALAPALPIVVLRPSPP